MKVCDLTWTPSEVFQLRSTDESLPERLRNGDEVFLTRPEGTSDVLLHFADVPPFAVEGETVADKRRLSLLLERNLSRLCWLCSRWRKGGLARVTLQVCTFRSVRHLWPETITIGVDQRIADAVRKRCEGISSDPEKAASQAADWLNHALWFEPEPGRSRRRALLSAAWDPDARKQSGFRIYGAEIAVDVERTSEGKLRVRTLVGNSQPQSEDYQGIALAEADFSFCEPAEAAEVRGQSRLELERLVARADSYLSLWKKYNDLERRVIWQQARTFGSLRYSSWHPAEDRSLVFQLIPDEQADEQLFELASGEATELEASEGVPAELTAPEETEEELTSRWADRSAPRNTFVGRCTGADINMARRQIRLQPLKDEDETNPPRSGYLYLSLFGDKIRLKRRNEAEQRIRTQRHHLGLLLEGEISAIARYEPKAKIPQFVRDVFGGKPTRNQLDALRMAMNTPDMALIQGPPGTGKTRTIAALVAWLAEETAQRPEGSVGQVLLTSFQHDAVENAAGQTSVFGLPAIKVGRGQQLDENDNAERWIRERREQIRAQLADLGEEAFARQTLRDVRNRVLGYNLHPGGPEESVILLREILASAGEMLPGSLRDQLRERARRLSQTGGRDSSDDEEQERVRNAVRGLRTEGVSFADDGSSQAVRALTILRLRGLLQPEEEELLRRAASWTEESAPSFLAELHDLRNRLLDQLQPAAQGVSAMTDSDTQQLLTQVIDALHTRVLDSAAGKGEVLAEYLDDLENDPEGVREALKQYTVVLAATCNHAASQSMARIKRDQLDFSSVIVDEAARANPLDLFIPMSLATRRVVLVGDHRQLPHILEPSLERELRNAEEQTRQRLQQSLFERLFLQFREADRRENVRRTVTLDTQYRMHRLLGDFVSRTFYEYHGEPKIKSVRPDSDFVHALPGYEGKVAAWIDMPASAGQEVGRQSKARPSEAQWIAKELLRLAQDAPHLSFGVISFYSAQVTRLWLELTKVGIAEKLEQGGYRVAEPWRETRDQSGRLTEHVRVGTVDAFQGMEFDVVLLSMTRSNRIDPIDEQQLRRKYGHLMLENRLCVAMSRQKRLLLVVGDLGMLEPKAAADAVRPLVQFHRELCGGNHVPAR